jgi:hypothetical protein
VIPTAVAIVYRQELQDHGNRHTDNSRRQDLQDLPSGELAERIGPVACPVGRVEHIAQVAGRERESNPTKECSDCVESRRRLALTRIDPSVRQEQHFLQWPRGLSPRGRF